MGVPPAWGREGARRREVSKRVDQVRCGGGGSEDLGEQGTRRSERCVVNALALQLVCLRSTQSFDQFDEQVFRS